MADRNTTQYGILGLLTWGPKSGYDIRKEVRESIGHFWSESYGQIYPVLRRLVARGLATVRTTSGKAGTARKVYRITPAGRRALRRWLAEPVRASPVRSELCLKLCFGVEAPVDVSRRHIEAFRRLHAERLATYEKTERMLRALQRQTPEAVYFLLTVRMGRSIAEACIRWADDSLADLRQYEQQRGVRRTTATRSTATAGSKRRRTHRRKRTRDDA